MSSIIKVDTVQDQDGNNIINENANTVTVGKSGDTVNIVGTITGFTSTGIDDNATSTAITIDSSENVSLTSILKVDTIQDQSGNNIINESADTITIGASGDTINVVGTLQNNGAAVGGDNTPAFAAYQSSGQSIDSDTTTIVTLDTEIFDTDSAFASNTFTVPAGEGGKYYISASVRADASWGATTYFNVSVFLGATGDNGLFVANQINGSIGNSAAVSGIMDLSAGDEITMRIRHNEGGTEGLQAGRYCTVFSGYKLIGV